MSVWNRKSKRYWRKLSHTLVLQSHTVGFDLVSLELSQVEFALPGEWGTKRKNVIQDATVKWNVFPRDSFGFLILVCSTERNPEKSFVFLRCLNYSNGRKCFAFNYRPTGTLWRPRFPTPELPGAGQARTCWQNHLFIYLLHLKICGLFSNTCWYWFLT